MYNVYACAVDDKSSDYGKPDWLDSSHATRKDANTQVAYLQHCGYGAYVKEERA